MELNWKMNSAGDFEAIGKVNRYRIDEWNGSCWLYKLTVTETDTKTLIGRYPDMELAKLGAEKHNKRG